MAVITVTGAPGCRAGESARLLAKRLSFEFISGATLDQLLVDDFGESKLKPRSVFIAAALSTLARLATEHHLVLCFPGAETLAAELGAVLRVLIVAPDKHRTGNLMVEYHLDKRGAEKMLAQLDRESRDMRKRRFGRTTTRPDAVDLTINTEDLDPDHAAAVIEQAARICRLPERGLLPAPQEADLQFQSRLQLARRGIRPVSQAKLSRKPFANDSEQIFANLLDFYRIEWQYEPRSFPIQWDEKGRVTEAFTPDFFLPELNLYIELTTMKQANVTRKNRKIRLLKSLYPQIQVQVFYQKDFQNLVFKYGLAQRPVPA